MGAAAGVEILEMIEGGTENDASDMKRLWKHQEFKVPSVALTVGTFPLRCTLTIEELPISLDAGVHFDFPCHLGICSRLLKRWTSQRRIWGAFLGFRRHRDLLLVCCGLFGGDGVHVRSPCDT